jgi:hypothetical protein
LLTVTVGGKAAEDGERSDLWDDREISLMGKSSVTDLYEILKNWEKLKFAMGQYAAARKNTRLSACDINTISIESIKGISRYTQHDLGKYHPDIAKLIENAEKELQSLVTTHPCFSTKEDRNITWYFFSENGIYSVIEHATVL